MAIKGGRRSTARSAHTRLAVAAVAMAALFQPAAAKLPGSVHCFNDICHRVRTVAETEARRGIVEPLIASFYDSPERDRFNPRMETSSGARFDPDADDNAASPIHPDGTVLLLWSPATRGAAVVRINNAGPYYPGRTLDVSRAVAERLGFKNGGTMELFSTIISAPSEPDSHYVRGRRYAKVRGFLGTFDSIAVATGADPTVSAAIETTGLVARDLTIPENVIPEIADEHIRWNDFVGLCEAASAEILAPEQQAVDLVFALHAPSDDFSPAVLTTMSGTEPAPALLATLNVVLNTDFASALRP